MWSAPTRGAPGGKTKVHTLLERGPRENQFALSRADHSLTDDSAAYDTSGSEMATGRTAIVASLGRFDAGKEAHNPSGTMGKPPNCRLQTPLNGALPEQLSPARISMQSAGTMPISFTPGPAQYILDDFRL